MVKSKKACYIGVGGGGPVVDIEPSVASGFLREKIRLVDFTIWGIPAR